MTVEHDRPHADHADTKFPHDNTEHEIIDAEVDPETERAQHLRDDEADGTESAAAYGEPADDLGERSPAAAAEPGEYDAESAGEHGVESESADEERGLGSRPETADDLGADRDADSAHLENDSREGEFEQESGSRTGEYEPESGEPVLEPETGLPAAEAGDRVAEADGQASDVEGEQALGSDPGVVAERLEANGFGTSEQTAPAPAGAGSDPGPLFATSDIDGLRTRFREAQGNFVDDPRDAVVKADELVTETIQQLTTVLAERKQALEGRWSRDSDGGDVTEDLRQALRSYRTFLDQLLAVGH
ncbi:hypothetical protein [Nocardia sp. BMG111209]|uniref:hypothetical protein n=1 Tax=Nocardia sp. BMG111209 TaxID=1160137 RepID=UPI00036A8D01|nr:hypothetical protein [Nocardia sp. BMG111209]